MNAIRKVDKIHLFYEESLRELGLFTLQKILV